MDDNNLTLDILKWAGIVFAAGFVGYFGRYLSMVIIDRVRRKRAARKASTETPVISPASSPPLPSSSMPPSASPSPSLSAPATPAGLELEKQRVKLEKKRAKAEAKRLKKAGKK